MIKNKTHKTVRNFVALALAFGLLAGCGGSGDTEIKSEPSPEPAGEPTNEPVAENRPVIVVTYSVLGDIVSQLVGDNATVTVVIPDGQDPHDFQPSAKDVETMNNAALVVSNGLDFEEGLEEVIENIADSGGEVFMVGDHVTVRKTEEEDGHSHSHGDDDDEDADHAEGEDGHGHGAGDPHLWLSPATMLEMLPALSKALSAAAGTDLSEAEKVLTTELEELDKQITTIINGLDGCKLVSGHDEMGYFADRYGCEVIGAIIPSLTTTSEATAGELADLKKLAQKNKVKAIFTGLGTSPDIANQIASELGVKAVTLSTHYLDGATNYQEFILRMVQQIAEALG